MRRLIAQPSRDCTVHAVRDLLVSGENPDRLPFVLGIQHYSILASLNRSIARAQDCGDEDWADLVRALRACVLRPGGALSPVDCARRRREALAIVRASDAADLTVREVA